MSTSLEVRQATSTTLTVTSLVLFCQKLKVAFFVYAFAFLPPDDFSIAHCLFYVKSFYKKK